MAARADHLAGLFSPPLLGRALAPPATPAMIARAEKAVGVALPEALKAALLVQNGGPIRRSSFKLKPAAAKQYGLKLYSLSTLPSAAAAGQESVVALTKLARKGELPKGLIPLDGDGHAWCCLDYRECGPKGEPRVAHVDLEQERDFTVARSFGELLKGLFQDEESLRPALIALDKGAPKGAALEAALQRLGCAKHKLPGTGNRKYPRPPTWRWRKFRGLLRGEPVWIRFEKNKLYRVSIAKTDQRPAAHPMLTIAVKPADEPACLEQLVAGLGKGAVLISGVS